MKKILFSVALMASVTSFAQSNSFKPTFYAGIEAGISKVKDLSSGTASDLVDRWGGTASASQDTTVNTGRIFAGYKVTENFDLEVGYFKTANLGETFSGVSGSLHGSVAYLGSSESKFSGYDYSVLVRPSLSTGWNNAFLAVGGHRSEIKQTTTAITALSRASQSGKVSGNGYLYAVGYDLNVAKNIDLRLKATRLERIADVSEAKGTLYSVGVLSKF